MGVGDTYNNAEAVSAKTKDNLPVITDIDKQKCAIWYNNSYKNFCN